uniref:Uncharacterized protein n=1 Tax=Arundo donax TaxID=35708 RepID=A0A0A9D493_ARUDO
MNITAFPPSHPVMENSRTWMVLACRIMVILLLVGFTASFIFTCSWFIDINFFSWVVEPRILQQAPCLYHWL